MRESKHCELRAFCHLAISNVALRVYTVYTDKANAQLLNVHIR